MRLHRRRNPPAPMVDRLRFHHSSGVESLQGRRPAWWLALLLVSALAAVGTRALAGDLAGMCFSPSQNCTAAIVGEISATRREILAQAYSLTGPEIVEALIEARRRGIDVRVILDSVQAEGDWERKAATRMAANGIVVLLDGAHGQAHNHNKVMILDRRRVLTGSFNFTRSARRNAENLVTLDGEEPASRYREDWLNHEAHATPWAKQMQGRNG